jgi:hypothetical protein
MTAKPKGKARLLASVAPVEITSATENNPQRKSHWRGQAKEKARLRPSFEQLAWTVPSFAAATDLSEAYVWAMVKDGTLVSVRSGKRTLIRTSPTEYLDSLVAA